MQTFPLTRNAIATNIHAWRVRRSIRRAIHALECAASHTQQPGRRQAYLDCILSLRADAFHEAMESHRWLEIITMAWAEYHHHTIHHS